MVTNYVQTWCKPKAYFVWRKVPYDVSVCDVPRVYAAGCARSDFATCLLFDRTAVWRPAMNSPGGRRLWNGSNEPGTRT